MTAALRVEGAGNATLADFGIPYSSPDKGGVCVQRATLPEELDPNEQGFKLMGEPVSCMPPSADAVPARV